MTCDEFLNRCDEQQDAGEAWRDAPALVEHAQGCAACQAYAAALDALDAALAPSPVAPPRGFAEWVVAAALAADGPSAAESDPAAREVSEDARSPAAAPVALQRGRSSAHGAPSSKHGRGSSAWRGSAAAAAAVILVAVGLRGWWGPPGIDPPGPTAAGPLGPPDAVASDPVAPERAAPALAHEARQSWELLAADARQSVADVSRLFGEASESPPAAAEAVPDRVEVSQAASTTGAFDFLIFVLPMGSDDL